ncbi:hypothetical protein Xen7305DRAFT_00008900 [Xenococcus sp. PCC 7305]|uniref:hypothetical protein n=1 Tax=Xenococcus sp. PCC 7305 TaxID=102125 RepID=UPI0002ACD139|nr:hypothetical protein [Xenococcus sp. PCC 7305]ELS01188.1 hypothetical protein Xen7305DRAFT_00008900 [Xenococcus sp. PCC 7305]
MSQQLLEPQAPSSGFNALAFELKHYEDYQRLNTPYYEVIGRFDHNDGIHKFLLLADCFQAGEYYKDPWGSDWIGKSFCNGNSKEVLFSTRDLAVAYLKRQYAASC